MFSEQKALVELIGKATSNYQKQIEKLMSENDSTYERYHKNRALLEESMENITSIPLKELAEVIAESNVEEKDRELEFNYMKSIRTLLDLNQTKQTTFQLSQIQRSYYERFMHQLREIENKSEEKVKNNLVTLNQIKGKIKQLKHLLGVLEDSKNREYIDQLDVIEELFQTTEASEEEKRAILYGILRYNRDTYHHPQVESQEEKPRLNLGELKELFASHGYDLSELKENLIENLLAYGSLSKMEEVFHSLEELKFPKFDCKRNGIKLVALLLNANPLTLEEMVAFGKSKRLSPKDLLLLLPALIDQKESRQRKEKGEIGTDNPCFITGRNKDFQANIELFESIGFRTDYIFKKCKELLVMPHEKLVSNYQKFCLYGFTIKQDMYGDLVHPALSCLLSNNFEEIVDQFIEISREGHRYIKENMSRITTTTSPKDILFYNMYASYMDQDDRGEHWIPEGPFTSTNHRNLHLRGEITRYAGSGYENTSYRGINEENKEQKTMTVEITFPDQEDFDYAVAEAKTRPTTEEDMISTDPKLIDLEEFTDEQDPLRYDFNGVLISKPKVFRIYNALKEAKLDSLEDSLLYAITYNSILSEDALERIKTILRDRRK